MTISAVTGSSKGFFSLGVVGDIFSIAGSAIADITQEWADAVEDDKDTVKARRALNRATKQENIDDAMSELRIRQQTAALRRQHAELEATLSAKKIELEIHIKLATRAKYEVAAMRIPMAEKLIKVNAIQAKLDEHIAVFKLIAGEVSATKATGQPSLTIEDDWADFATVTDDQSISL
jgi:hypothetical protein